MICHLRRDIKIFDNKAEITVGSEKIDIFFEPEVFTPKISAESYIDTFSLEKHVNILDFITDAENEFTATFKITP